MANQPFQSVLSGTKSICLISGNTDGFILLIHFIDKLKLNSTVYMQVTSDEQNLLSITISDSLYPSKNSFYGLRNAVIVKEFAGQKRSLSHKQPVDTN